MLRSRSRFLVLAMLAAVPAHGLADQPHSHAADDPRQLGKVELASSCTADVRAELNHAVALLHSFWYREARRRFTTVAGADPRCAIAHWGIAMTYWHPLWEPRGPAPGAMRAGGVAIEQARAIRAGTPRERELIEALATFFSDAERVDHRDRVIAYERAMAALHRRYPGDTELRVFYALALVGSAMSLPPDKTYARQRRAGRLLEPVFRARPDHPGAAHYIIHAYDYPVLARGALAAARRYAEIAPDSPHALHMPSHIFTRLGLWDESIASNRAVLAVARRRGERGEELHGRDYLVFAHLQKGEDDQARALLEDIPVAPEGDPLYFAGVYARAASPARFAIERRRWEEAAALEVPDLPGGRYAWAGAAVHFARALGATRVGDLEQAREDLERIAEAERTLGDEGEDYWATQVQIQRRAVEAWIAFAEGRTAEALRRLRAAAALEDSTDKHPVTPGAIVPARDLLGQMLLELGKPAAAGREFAKVLAVEPNRFGAVWGAARAAELSGQRERARELYTQLVELAPDSDRPQVRHARAVIGRAAE